jgi:predicted nucleic acid-binding protein
VAVLDTSFLIDLEADEPRAWARLEGLTAAAAPFRVPAAVWIEYLAPMSPAERSDAARALESLVQFVPLDRGIADRAATLQAEMLERGKPLAWHDLQVAATALEVQEEVVSNDARFRDVPGIAVRGW